MLETITSYDNATVGFRVDYPQPDARLDLWGGTSGTFAGIDRFGRVIDQRWQNDVSGTPTDIDRYQYGYDRNSNRQYRANLVGTAAVGNLDEYYTYDTLNRLTLMKRGTLTGTPPSGISGTPVAQQDWTLDDTGNWDQFLVKASGSTTLNQTRTQNPVNEITAISETVGSSWIDPTYDAAGNMISGPKASAETTRLHFIFDAWNRMVTLKADSSGSPGSTIASYVYDGLNRRIQKTIGGHTYNGYYNANWQYLETRVDSGTTSAGQVVWDLRYIDSPLVLLNGAHPWYYTNDANFNVTSLINGDTGAVAEREQYDPYGQPRFYTAAWAATSSSAANNPFMFAGYVYDSESGMYLARFRYMHPTLAVWHTRELFNNLIASLLPYNYCRSNPNTEIDPSGCDPNWQQFFGGPPFVGNPKPPQPEKKEAPAKWCGPDVSKWFALEVESWLSEAKNLKAELGAGFKNIAFEGLLDKLATLQAFNKYGPMMQYKVLDFQDDRCCGCPNTVTVCELCLSSNQLGNIVYGVVAAVLEIVESARGQKRGRGSFFDFD